MQWTQEFNYYSLTGLEWPTVFVGLCLITCYLTNISDSADFMILLCLYYW